MTMRRILAGVALAGLSLFIGAAPAFGDTSATIEQVQSESGELDFVVALNDVPADASIDLDEASATLEGIPLDVSVQELSDDSTLNQTALLVMDTSDSMDGEKLDAAKDAAVQFIDAVPAEVEIGLITFDNVAELRVPPTRDREELETTIASLDTAPETVLYDAVDLAASQLRDIDLGSALLLSDGADRGSDVSREDAVQAAERSGARFDVVSFGTSTAQVAALTDIATATDGSVYEAGDTAALLDAFNSAASSISNRFVASAPLPEGFSQDSGTIAVTIPVTGPGH